MAAARYKAEGERLERLWAPIKAAQDEESRNWWRGVLHRPSPDRFASISRPPPGRPETRENTGPVQAVQAGRPLQKPGAGTRPHACNQPVEYASPQACHSFTLYKGLDGLDGLDGISNGTGLDRLSQVDGRWTGRTDLDHCRKCGERINWRTDGVAFADGKAAHNRCYEKAASSGPVF